MRDPPTVKRVLPHGPPGQKHGWRVGVQAVAEGQGCQNVHMSKSDEFSHGTEHRFGVTREFPGSYKSCCGIGIESSALGGWNVTMPGQSHPDEWTNTLRDAKWMAENHHKQGSQ